MTEFISKVTPEKKKIRDLKFTLYSHGIQEEGIGGWATIILDKHEQKTVLSGKEEDIKDNRIDMIAIIEGLNWVYCSVEPKYRKYITVNLNSDNVYCINIIKDWLDKWEETIDSKPNSDLLKSLIDLKDKMKINAMWTHKVSNEYSWSVNRISKERLNEV
jgi:ribonuclease HI